MVRTFHCRRPGMAGAMSINSTACLFVLSFLSNNAYCRETENAVPVRYERGNLQEYMGDASDPNFWPVRGRRSEKSDESFTSFPAANLVGDFSFRRGGRKPKEEETTGVFWAGRGRSYDVAIPDHGYFWAHRGRSFEPWSEDPLPRNRLTAEEPGWIWIVRGEPQTGKAPKPGEEDRQRTCSNIGKTKREILRQRLCHLKRKANTLLREIPQTEQFWPVRGKREEESWQENLRELKTFWPARGRRDEDPATNKDKQQPVNSKEVT